MTARRILRTYVVLTLLSTFASSFIWGVNTLFLLDAGLTVTQAFAVNAFFTGGLVVFEVPTGVLADTLGRRASYLLGTATLFLSTALYLAMWWQQGPFWAWAASSALLGLGFTFFSGATDAWLVDGLAATRWEGTLDAAFARGQVAEGAGMLVGTVAGGALAQATSLGAPYVVRAALLAVTFAVAFAWMRDVGFAPRRGAAVFAEVRAVLRASLEHGLRRPPVRWLMLAGAFEGSVAIFAFYAMQPYLLELYGRSGSYAVAGLAAATVAAAQIVGAWVAPLVRRAFRRRTSALLLASLASAACLAAMGVAGRFGVALGALAAWALLYGAIAPVRQALVNELIPSAQRATVLSFDSLLASAGGVVSQPALGRMADGVGYPASYLASAGVHLLAVPFLVLARRERPAADAVAAEERAAGS